MIIRVILLAAVICLMPVPAAAVLIDFESPLLVGDGITDVNALTTPMGATFDVSPGGQARPGGLFEIVLVGSNQVARSGTWPAEADILINFSSPVNFVQVMFVDNPNGDDLNVSLTAFAVTGSAVDLLGLGPSIASVNGTEPTMLSLSATGIRSVQVESFSGQIFFDNVRFSVAEPTTLALMGLGLASIGFARKKKQS